MTSRLSGNKDKEKDKEKDREKDKGKGKEKEKDRGRGRADLISLDTTLRLPPLRLHDSYQVRTIRTVDTYT